MGIPLSLRIDRNEFRSSCAVQPRAIGERTSGALLLTANGRRMDRHATYIVATYIAGAAR
jgi:hypothetical protein